MSTPQFTTPTFTLTFNDAELDLTTANNVYVTFECGGDCLTKTGEEITVAAKQIDIPLSQAETGKMSGTVRIQANWTSGDGQRAASEIAVAVIGEQLLKKVVE